MQDWEFRIDNADLISAVRDLEARIGTSAGEERSRLTTGLSQIDGSSPEWVTSWPDWTTRTFHFVPGPKLVELLMPIERLEIPRAGVKRGRWKQVARHLKAAWEAVRS